MPRFLGGPVRLSAVALVISFLLTVPPIVVAQPSDRACAENVAQVDDFQSTGIGLTSDELVALMEKGKLGKA